MQERLESLASKAREEIGRAQEASGLEALRVRYLGKKGELSAVLGGHGEAARPRSGAGWGRSPTG